MKLIWYDWNQSCFFYTFIVIIEQSNEVFGVRQFNEILYRPVGIVVTDVLIYALWPINDNLIFVVVGLWFCLFDKLIIKYHCNH